jgi:pimeloyl-ACP methyl ester carboxylesterase
VDSSRIMILGHSEGGLIALVVAADRANQVKALGLINGLSRPYLQTLRDQTEDQVSAAVRLGQMPASMGDQLLRLTDAINQSLLQNGTLPSAYQIPEPLQLIYNPANVKFLATVGKLDPKEIASSLPKTFPALVTCGEKDFQVSCSDVKNVLDGFKQSGNDHVTALTLKNTNHVLKVVEGESKGTADYVDPSLPFSDQMRQSLIEFVKKNL